MKPIVAIGFPFSFLLEGGVEWGEVPSEVELASFLNYFLM